MDEAEQSRRAADKLMTPVSKSCNALPSSRQRPREPIVITLPLGVLHLRAELPDDRAFRFELFCQSRPPILDFAQLVPGMRHQLMTMQFEAQARSYEAAFPHACFAIIELAGEPIGRIVVDRPGDAIHIVDQAIVPKMRRRGIGSAIMRALMDEAALADIPVRLAVADDNEPALRLYARLGFRHIGAAGMYRELEWRAEG